MATDNYDDQEVEAEVVETGTFLAATTRAEIDSQVATAKRYPRSLRMFQREVREMALLTQDIAGECFYSLKRGGKVIEGPSARLAEIVASAWGNCQAAARIVAEDDRFVTAQGVFIDMQRNVRIVYEVKRRITDKNGHRYNDDMIGVTSNAACSIALRNAVFKGVPKAFWSDIYGDCRKAAIGDAKSISQTRHKLIGEFAKMGVSSEQVFGYLEINGEEDMTLDHIGLMRGLFTAIRDGDATIDETFGHVSVPSGKVRKSSVSERLKPKPEAEPADPLAAFRAEQEAWFASASAGDRLKRYDEYCGPDSQREGWQIEIVSAIYERLTG